MISVHRNHGMYIAPISVEQQRLNSKASPGTMLVTVPPNSGPGSTLQVQTATGLVQVQVPQDCGPGSTFSIHTPSGTRTPTSVGATMRAVVPTGMSPGQCMDVQTPGGIVSVQIPAGIPPGGAFTFQAPVATAAGGTEMQVRVPKDSGPGQMVKVQTLTAGTVSVQVPAGVGPGCIFSFIVPPTSPQALRAPNPRGVVEPVGATPGHLRAAAQTPGVVEPVGATPGHLRAQSVVVSPAVDHSACEKHWESFSFRRTLKEGSLTDDRLRGFFSLIDADRSGYIDAEELEEAAEQCAHSIAGSRVVSDEGA